MYAPAMSLRGLVIRGIHKAGPGLLTRRFLLGSVTYNATHALNQQIAGFYLLGRSNSEALPKMSEHKSKLLCYFIAKYKG